MSLGGAGVCVWCGYGRFVVELAAASEAGVLEGFEGGNVPFALPEHLDLAAQLVQDYAERLRMENCASCCMKAVRVRRSDQQLEDLCGQRNVSASAN